MVRISSKSQSEMTSIVKRANMKPKGDDARFKIQDSRRAFQVSSFKFQVSRRKFHDSRFKFHEEGFSLIELIIYIGIVTAISSVFVAIIVNLSLSWTRSKVESEVQQNVRSALQSISQTIRSAQRVTVPAAGSSGASLMAVVDGQNVRYFLTTTAQSVVLQKQTGANPVENITTDSVKVSYLNFTTFENSATTTERVITATATSTRYGISIQYNTADAQFSYTQNATSTETVWGSF